MVCSERIIVAGETAQQLEALPQNPHQSQGKNQFPHLFSDRHTYVMACMFYIYTLYIQMHDKILEDYTRQIMSIGLLKNNREPVLYETKDYCCPCFLKFHSCRK